MDNERLKYGGQAVIEGVMMRSPRYFAVACRRETDQKLVVRLENVESALKGWQWLNKPFLRGTLALVDSLFMGYKALMYSAGIQLEAEEEKNSFANSLPPNGSNGKTAKPHKESADEKAAKDAVGKPINNIAIGGTTIVALLIALVVIYGLPTMATQLIQKHYHWLHPTLKQGLALNFVDLLIRLTFFLGYILLISQMNHVKRIFQYHGAEHKAINTLEAGEELTLENARQASRIHPRCGTNFIFIVLIVHFFVVACFGRPIPGLRFVINLAVLPIVAGIAFEILKFAGNNRDKKWAQFLIAPGLATQYLTTRPPLDDQIEVALESLKAVWNKEHERPETPAEQKNEEPAAAVA